MQVVFKLPGTRVVGPARKPPCYDSFTERMKELNKPQKLEELSAELHREIDECYEEWRSKAVDELLQAQDRDPAEVPDYIKQTAGGVVKMKWEDPRKLAKTGRAQKPMWTGACQWLESARNENIQLK